MPTKQLQDVRKFCTIFAVTVLRAETGTVLPWHHKGVAMMDDSAHTRCIVLAHVHVLNILLLFFCRWRNADMSVNCDDSVWID